MISPEETANAVLTLFRQVHDQLRHEVTGLDAGALNWVPVRDANSIATIVTHVLGSEAETLRCVAGIPVERERDAEFAGRALTPGHVLRLLDDADALIITVQPHWVEARLEATFALPTLPADDVRTGFAWLIRNYGHAREHLGHIQLTTQLYRGMQR